MTLSVTHKSITKSESLAGAMSSSSKKENHRHSIAFALRRWVVFLIAMLFSSALGVYWVQNQLANKPLPRLHKPDQHVEQDADRSPSGVAQKKNTDQQFSQEDHSAPKVDTKTSYDHPLGQEDHPFPKMASKTHSSDSAVQKAGGNIEAKASKTSSSDSTVQKASANIEAKSSRFLQSKIEKAHKDAVTSTATAKEGKYIGPWKMTFASAAPTLARDFCMKYLGAEHYYFTFPGMPSCAELQWISFPGAPMQGEVPKPWRKKPFRFFQFHFVKHHRRPTGPMTIEQLELKLKAMHGNFTEYNQFMDNRVTMEADDLDPIAARLIHDKHPLLARENVDGSFSLFMEVPHAILLELVGPKLTVLKARAWSRCDGPLPPVEVDWSLVGNQLNVSVGDVRPRGFVYASTKPKAAATLHTSYFLGQPTQNSSLLLEKGNGTCFDAQSVQWSQPEGINKFELQWVHWPQAQTQAGALQVRDVEQYQLQLRSNLSEAHANNWDHYMDFHAGLFIEDCDPVIERLRADGIPHFLTPHFMKFMAVFIQDEGGLVYEVVCHKFSLAKIRDLKQWDFCKRLPPLAIDWSPLLNSTSGGAAQLVASVKDS
eukprot:gnl/MRDRNA2_/MRDRNA2_101715_c0_seq1.p1 gnl/MRDRNA2_/MRDRNA2_101715_c0~~gnl/MRDRNA2_/MRDRNA2_101715_c0_seq1.p1  ORF type:complete len:598 (+),score=101.83 gnl/MRDRNA2_/MRDRNA2_101715_c0_seq1:123-1916(+)